jgi:hypothetical protein
MISKYNICLLTLPFLILSKTFGDNKSVLPIAGVDSCKIDNNPNNKCKGYCPPCWLKNKDNTYSCYEYTSNTYQCPSWDGMENIGHNSPAAQWPIFRNLRCNPLGDKSQEMRASSYQALPCWRFQYSDQSFHCFEYDNFSCPKWQNVVDIRLMREDYILNHQANVIIESKLNVFGDNSI